MSRHRRTCAPGHWAASLWSTGGPDRLSAQSRGEMGYKGDRGATVAVLILLCAVDQRVIVAADLARKINQISFRSATGRSSTVAPPQWWRRQAKAREVSRLPRVRRSTKRAEEWQAIAGLPYGWRTCRTSPGVFRLGNQSAVIWSLAATGLPLLTSGVAAATALLRVVRRVPTSSCRIRAPIGLASALSDVLRTAAETKRSRSALMRLPSVPQLARLAATLTRIG